MNQLELFEEINNTTKRVWNQSDAAIKSEIVTKLGRLIAKACQKKMSRVKEEDTHDKFQ